MKKFVLFITNLFIFSYIGYSIEWKYYPEVEAISFCEDKNSIWIGSFYNGLIKFDKQNFNYENYTTLNSEIPENIISSIQIDKNQKLWLGVGTSGLIGFDGNNWEIVNNINPKIPKCKIMSICLDSTFNIWIATFGYGIFVKINDEIINFNKNNSSLITDSIRCLVTDDKGTIWAGSHHNGLFKFNGQDWENYNIKNSEICSDTIFSMVLQKSKLIIGTNLGLSIFNQENWENTDSINSSLPDRYLNTIAVDSNSNIWCGSIKFGFSKIYNQQIELFNSENSLLPDNFVLFLFIDRNNNKWIYSNNGVSIFNEDKIILNIENLKNCNNYYIYPNPSTLSNSININCNYRNNVNIQIELVNNLGIKVSDIFSGFKEAGEHTIQFTPDASFPSGVYWVRMIMNGTEQIVKPVVFISTGS